MALDICFDLKTFLERTCRSCSRYFAEDGGTEGEMQFRCIFADMGVAAATDLDGTPQPSEEIREIYEELCIWQLNIKPGDGLPQQLCSDCIARFRSVKLFREECLDTQKVLASYFKDFDTLLETASLGKLAPRSDGGSVKSEPRGSPAPSFNADDLVEEVPESPERLQQLSSPYGSPKFRFSPKFHEAVYAESSMGTPPPLFEEIKTEPIDMQTMEYIKTEAEVQAEDKIKLEKEAAELAKSQKTLQKQQHFASSDDESSTPTSDEESDCTSDSDDNTATHVNYRRRNTTDSTDYNPRNLLQCKICFTSFSKRSLLKEHHLRVHPQEKPYTCNICASAFKSNFLLAQHKLKHNNPNSLKCEQCGKYFRSQLHLQRHAKNFHLTSTYTCHICHEKFENYTQMRFQYHVRQHGEKRFQCQFCEKSFHQKIHLMNHERTHTKAKPFQCNICGKAYRQQTECQEHMLTHTDPTPFKCKICQKGFTQRSSLRLHYRTHTNVENNKQFHCELCGQNFAQKVHYEMHQLTHSADRRQAIHVKQRVHLKTPIKMFKCQLCDKSFGNKQMQLLHEQQHKQEPHFKCSFCNEAFMYRATLGKHMLSHLEGAEDDIMDYSCSTAI